MAVYKFTHNIVNNKPIPLFTAAQVLERDFTYVDDVVGVFLAALDRIPQCCGEVYNAGLGQRQKLSTLVNLIQEMLGTTASTVSAFVGTRTMNFRTTAGSYMVYICVCCNL